MSDLGAEISMIDLGDQRLNRRAEKVLESLGNKPTQSIPAACGGWDETKAVYRLFEVDPSVKTAPHQEQDIKILLLKIQITRRG